MYRSKNVKEATIFQSADVFAVGRVDLLGDIFLVSQPANQVAGSYR